MKHKRLRKRTKDSENGGITEKASEEDQHQKHRSALRALKNKCDVYCTIFLVNQIFLHLKHTFIVVSNIKDFRLH